MSRTGTKDQVFQEIALAHVHGEVTIDELRELYEAQQFWTPEEEAQASRDWKNNDLRHRARKKFVDEEGNVREIVNIKRKGADPTETQNFFMFIEVTTREDLEWLVADRLKRKSYFGREATRLLDIYAERYGKRAARLFQRRLGLVFEDE